MKAVCFEHPIITALNLDTELSEHGPKSPAELVAIGGKYSAEAIRYLVAVERIAFDHNDNLFFAY